MPLRLSLPPSAWHTTTTTTSLPPPAFFRRTTTAATAGLFPWCLPRPVLPSRLPLHPRRRSDASTASLTRTATWFCQYPSQNNAARPAACHAHRPVPRGVTLPAPPHAPHRARAPCRRGCGVLRFRDTAASGTTGNGTTGDGTTGVWMAGGWTTSKLRAGRSSPSDHEGRRQGGVAGRGHEGRRQGGAWPE